MTQEQEAAAKWLMFEEYNSLKGKLPVLTYKVREWGEKLANVSNVLLSNPEALPNLNLTEFPEKAEMMSVQNELRTLYTKLGVLRKSLRQAGMSLEDCR